jgi:hypothetical protein
MKQCGSKFFLPAKYLAAAAEMRKPGKLLTGADSSENGEPVREFGESIGTAINFTPDCISSERMQGGIVVRESVEQVALNYYAELELPVPKELL